MSLPVKLNALVPLSYLSPYGTTGLFVRARIFDEAGNLLSTKNLTEVEDGRYTNATYFMPNRASLLVRYDIYTDATYTEVDTNEGRHDERFVLYETPSDLIRNDELVLTFEDNSMGEIELVFEDSDITIELSDIEESIEVAMDKDSDFILQFEDEGSAINLQLSECQR